MGTWLLLFHISHASLTALQGSSAAAGVTPPPSIASNSASKQKHITSTSARARGSSITRTAPCSSMPFALFRLRSFCNLRKSLCGMYCRSAAAAAPVPSGSAAFGPSSGGGSAARDATLASTSAILARDWPDAVSYSSLIGRVGRAAVRSAVRHAPSASLRSGRCTAATNAAVAPVTDASTSFG